MKFSGSIAGILNKYWLKKAMPSTEMGVTDLLKVYRNDRKIGEVIESNIIFRENLLVYVKNCYKNVIS